LNDAVEKLEAKLGIGSSPASSATNGAVLVANGSGTTTYSGHGFGIWTAWTPTITSNSGTLTTVSGSGRYCRINNLIVGRLQIFITTNGTGATFIEATLPAGITPVNFTAGGGVGSFREYQSIGFSGAIALLSTTKFMLTKYDGTYPGGTNYGMHGNFSFEI
jgi:hypothetical protein